MYDPILIWQQTINVVLESRSNTKVPTCAVNQVNTVNKLAVHREAVDQAIMVNDTSDIGCRYTRTTACICIIAACMVSDQLGQEQVKVGPIVLPPFRCTG